MPADDLRPHILRVSRLRGSLLGLFALGVLSVGLAQCSTSGGTGSTVPKGSSSATPTPTPTPSTLPASATVMIPVGPSPGSGSLGPVLGGYSSTITFPVTETTGTITVTLSATQPGGTPTVQSMRRRPQTIGGVGLVPLAFLTFTSPTALTFSSTPSFSFTVPAAAVNAGQIPYLAYYDPTASPQTGWNTFAGPATVSGTTVTFPAMNGISGLGSTAGVTYDIVLFTVTSALTTPTPTPATSPTASPTASPTGSPTSTPTATPMPTPTPSPSPLSTTSEFGLSPTAGFIGNLNLGTIAAGNEYDVGLGWPSNNGSGFLVTYTLDALDDSAPLVSGNVYQMTLALSNLAPVTFSSGAQLSVESGLFSLSANYTMIVTGPFNTVTTVPQMPTQGFPGHFLMFPSPFSGLTVPTGGTVTVVIHQQ
jgi:hypothetical protein